MKSKAEFYGKDGNREYGVLEIKPARKSCRSIIRAFGKRYPGSTTDSVILIKKSGRGLRQRRRLGKNRLFKGDIQKEGPEDGIALKASQRVAAKGDGGNKSVLEIYSWDD